ncbi:MAG: hypothetical protein D6730_08005 [Bacteroidetes bacterium]|nr:MAG: hypothetical protein D6730_08005 [Bacteroidota bacterium]
MKLFLVKQMALLIGLLAVYGLSDMAAQQLKVGAAKRVLTPHPLLPVSGGVGMPKPAQRQLGDLFVRAVAFEKGETRFAVAVIDNLGWPAALGNRSRALVKGIPPEHILIGATHTHSGPDAYAFPNEKGETGADLAYLDWCVQEVAAAINEAIDKLAPAKLKIAEGEAKGRIAYNYYAPQLYDPRCNVIQAIGKEDGKVIATLVNYAIHPEVLGNSRGILSPDLCGPLYERIEARTDGMALFVNGALGGMVTADNRRDDGSEANDWEECKRIGYLLADEALRLLEEVPLQENPSLFCRAKTISFPVESPLMRFILTHSPLQIHTAGTPADSISTQLNLLNIGTAQVLTIPGEALPNIGYYLKRKMNGQQNFLFGLMNDGFGYILSKVDYNSFKRYSYITETSLGEMTGEILIEEALNLMQQSPAPDEPPSPATSK